MADRSGRGAHSLSGVWILTVVVAAAAAAAGARLYGTPVLPGAPFALDWWAVAPMFYVAEITVVHLRFHRHAHSFSLSEIPLVAGLFLAAPIHLLVGQAIGTGVALAIHRRQALVKLGFNIAQFSLQTVTAVVVFRMLAEEADPLGAPTSTVALLAVAAAFVVANVLVNTAIHLSGGRLTVKEMFQVLGLGGVASLMTGGLALGMLHLVWSHPESWPVALLPPVVLYLSYRGYVTQRQERAQLAEVYEATRELHRIPQIDQALVAITGRAQTMFEAEVARVVLMPETAEDVFTTATGPGDVIATMQRIDRDDVGAVAELAMVRQTGVIDEVWTGEAMAAPLFERDRVIGAFVVSDPVGEVARFGETDLKVLETLASQVSVTLENGRLEDSLVQLTRLKEELHHQALHDNLTGLANRRLLLERLATAIEGGANENDTALLFLDLDDFKLINDTHGHQAGDEMLRMVADRLLSACRAGDTVARIGGDEFAVLLTDLPRPHEAETIAERILENLSRPYQLRERPVWATASLGVAHLVAGTQPHELITRADQSMYAAKWSEKGTYQVFADSTSAGVFRWMELRSELPKAIENDDLELHYQPVVDMRTGATLGVEALLRWTHPSLGTVAPAEVLSVAEEAGLMVELGRRTIGRTLLDLTVMRRRLPQLWVSVNLSANQIDETLPRVVEDALVASGVGPGGLTLEITEATATQISEGVLEAIAALGVQIALDDFGTGYSSFARLDRLPIDILKIDRSFVAREPGTGVSPLMSAIVELGNSLGLGLIAEGVETDEHRQTVLDAGCDVAQGWLFAAAMPLDRFDAYLDRLATDRLLAAI